MELRSGAPHVWPLQVLAGLCTACRARWAWSGGREGGVAALPLLGAMLPGPLAM